MFTDQLNALYVLCFNALRKAGNIYFSTFCSISWASDLKFMEQHFKNIVTHMIPARQWLGKHVPKVKLSRTEESLKARIVNC
jgi:hypothetical protein